MLCQVLENDKWRSVCTNSRNWTAADMGVACRQLGFLGGDWYHWHEHINDTRQILYQDPGNLTYTVTVRTINNEARCLLFLSSSLIKTKSHKNAFSGRHDHILVPSPISCFLSSLLQQDVVTLKENDKGDYCSNKLHRFLLVVSGRGL